MSAWQCTIPHDDFRLTARGIEHAFSYQLSRGIPDKQSAVEAVEFLFSDCFNRQFGALGGQPFKPSPDADAVVTVVDEGKALRLLTGPLGNGNTYQLVRTDRKADGCGFNLNYARIAATNSYVPRGYEKIIAEQNERARKEHEAMEREAKMEQETRLRAEAKESFGREQLRAEPWGFSRAGLANAALSVSVIAAMLTLVVPWVLLATASRRAAAGATLGFAATGTVFGVASAVYEPHHVLIFIIPVALSWVMVVAFGGWALATGSKAAPAAKAATMPLRLAVETALWIVAIITVAVLASYVSPGWVMMVELLGVVALVAIPIFAVRTAIRYALAADNAASARTRGLLTTAGLCIGYGIIAGLAIDVLTGGQFMIPATVAYAMVEVAAGLVVGVIVAVICGYKVQARQAGKAQ